MKSIFSIVKWVSFATLSALLLLFVWIVLQNDFSTMPIDGDANPDLIDPKNRPGVYLVSYAAGKEIFFKNQQALAVSVLNRGVDFILNYRQSQVDPEFIRQHQEVFNQKIGAGYWLWKPWVILNTLKMIPENSLVIYSDSGFVVQNNIRPLINYMGDKNIMLIGYDQDIYAKPIEMCIRDVFVKLNCDEQKCWDGLHTWAALIFLRNTPKARDFIQQWLDLCSNHNLLIGKPSPDLPAYPRYKFHHHDEALLSVLYNKKISDGADYFAIYPASKLRKFFIWHHRHPGREYESLMPGYGRKINGFVRRYIINSSLLIYARKILVNKLSVTPTP